MTIPDLKLRDASPTTVTLNKNLLLVGGTAISFIVVGTFIFALSTAGVRQQAEVEEIPLETERAQAQIAVTTLFDGRPKTYADISPAPQVEVEDDIDYDTDETVIDYGYEEVAPAMPAPTVYQGPSPQEIAAAEAELAAKRRAWESPIAFDLGPEFSPQPRSQNVATSIPDLAALQAGAQTSSLELPQLSETANGNDPARKLQFASQNFSGATHVSNPYLARATLGHEVKAGSSIAASLITGINSDLPGTIVARVTRPVFDSVTGRALLIPQGSQLIGQYDSIISFAQERVQISWHRLILPNGGSIQLDNMPGVDQSGYAGIGGDVDRHLDSVATGIGISTTISGLAALLTSSSSSQSDAVDASVQAVQGQSSSVSNAITERYLNRQPTITVQPGTPVYLLLTKDLQLPTYENT